MIEVVDLQRFLELLFSGKITDYGVHNIYANSLFATDIVSFKAYNYNPRSDLHLPRLGLWCLFKKSNKPVIEAKYRRPYLCEINNVPVVIDDWDLGEKTTKNGLPTNKYALGIMWSK